MYITVWKNSKTFKFSEYSMVGLYFPPIFNNYCSVCSHIQYRISVLDNTHKYWTIPEERGSRGKGGGGGSGEESFRWCVIAAKDSPGVYTQCTLYAYRIVICFCLPIDEYYRSFIANRIVFSTSCAASITLEHKYFHILPPHFLFKCWPPWIG